LVAHGCLIRAARFAERPSNSFESRSTACQECAASRRIAIANCESSRCDEISIDEEERILI
jgi:hypothetical protein